MVGESVAPFVKNGVYKEVKALLQKHKDKPHLPQMGNLMDELAEVEEGLRAIVIGLPSSLQFEA